MFCMSLRQRLSNFIFPNLKSQRFYSDIYVSNTLSLTSQSPNDLKNQIQISEKISEEIIDTVSGIISNGNELKNRINPLFAVVFLYGSQYKITNYDLLRIKGFLPAELGEKIRLEKVLLVGGKDFTLVGRPLLPRDLVTIMATVVERGLTHMYTDYRHWKNPKLNTRMRLYRYNRTVLRINSIHIDNTPKQLENSEHQMPPTHTNDNVINN